MKLTNIDFLGWGLSYQSADEGRPQGRCTHRTPASNSFDHGSDDDSLERLPHLAHTTKRSEEGLQYNRCASVV